MSSKPGGSSCRKYKSLISLYTDGRLSEGEKDILLRHILTCAECSQRLESYKAMSADLRRMPGIIPDPSFHDETMTYIQTEAHIRAAHGKKLLIMRRGDRLKGVFGAAAAAVLAVICISALSAGIGQAVFVLNTNTVSDEKWMVANAGAGIMPIMQSFSGYDTDLITAAESGEAAGDAEFWAGDAPDGEVYGSGWDLLLFDGAEEEGSLSGGLAGQTLARTCHITVETPDVSGLLSYVMTLGGVTGVSAYRTQSGESANVTIKVPAPYFNTALETILELGNVVSRNEYAYAVGDEINSLDATLSSKREEYTRLISYIGRATDLGGVIMLEDRVHVIMNEIDNYQAKLDAAYGSADAPAIYLDIIETDAHADKNLRRRLKEAFSNSLLWILEAAQLVLVRMSMLLLPTALVVAAAVPVVYFAARFADRIVIKRRVHKGRR